VGVLVNIVKRVPAEMYGPKGICPDAVFNFLKAIKIIIAIPAEKKLR
jgi:hypothetical protein